jgi:hypothetical protein
VQKRETAHRLQTRLATVLVTVERELAGLTNDQLRQKPANGGWSITECLQHLNIFGRYYIHSVRQKVDSPQPGDQNANDQPLESSWIGRFAERTINPANPQELKTAPALSPKLAIEPPEALRQFRDLHQQLHDLLMPATTLDWNKTKIDWMLGKWLKFRLGDILQIIVSHAERHLNQALRVKADLR